MKSTILYLLAVLLKISSALFAEEAGKLDFLIATAGHGSVQNALPFLDNQYVVTVGGGNCFVACRSIRTGELLWRRNACARKKEDSSSTVSVSMEKVTDSTLKTFDGSVVRTWNVSTGTLETEVLDTKNTAIMVPEPVKSVSCNKQNYEIQNSQMGGVEADRLFLIDCSDDSSKRPIVMASSTRGTTTMLEFGGDSHDTPTVLWTREESLAFVKQAILLDAGHELESTNTHEILTFANRLQSQMRNLQTRETTIQHFGFIKLAVLFTDTRLYGMETVGERRGAIRWKVNLESAPWCKLVHGSYSQGVHGAAHTKELLIVSSNGGTINWMAIDGTTGQTTQAGNRLGLKSRIVQTIPVIHEGRQTALVIFQDGTIVNLRPDVLVPESLYAHSFDYNTLSSFGITNGEFLHPVGSTVFSNEEIVSVAYPNREETVSSPCSVLGDDSLLLKYINPHLVVVLTMGSSEAVTTIPPKTKVQKRKPAGVGTTSTTSSEQDEVPNLFVNVVDSVSGRVLYRASHTHAASSPKPQVTISENWIFYSFVNTMTRKNELGVLSLYEGMIDKQGLTAFSTPEQSTTFSSLDARETTPVVLAKTYIVPKTVTAMAVTSTRSGIATRKLLLAGMEGQIHGIDKKVLEPRRPIGALKDHEKKEGLVQYHELVPIVSFASLAYNQTVEGVTHMISAPTDLESQSLVLAFGGPDIYFTRAAPSRGFDLLPDNFNKPLLSVVVGGLVVALLVMKRMVAKKIRKQGWV